MSGRASKREWGFSLLEVMVAVAILGLSLSVIMSAEMGLFTSGKYAQNVSIAMGLSRCRMSEVEEKLLRDGYPLLDINEDGPCCAGEPHPRMSCSWHVEKIELPQAGDMDFGDGGPNPAGSAGGASPPPLGALGALAGVTGTGPNAPPSGVGNAGLSSVLSSGAGMAGASALAPMVMSIVYPSIKPMFEASIRKITVEVLWKEGSRKRSFVLTQWVTNPTQGGFLGGALTPGSEDGAAAPAAPGAVGTPTTTPATPSLPGMTR